MAPQRRGAVCMTKRGSHENKATANRARLKRTGEIFEAHQLRADPPPMQHPRGEEWVCPDRRCQAKMEPRACEPTKPDGEKWGKSAYFTTVGKHAPDCRPPDLDQEPRERPIPRSISGHPVDYPSRVNLFSVPVSSGGPTEPDEVGIAIDRDNKLHASSTRSLWRACEYYAADAQNHSKPLWIQGCAGHSYAECFVLLGTGGHEIVGPRRVFYGQVRFMTPIDYDAEPLVVPLFSPVGGVHRRLLIHTTTWTRDQRQDFQRRMRSHVEEGTRVHRPGGRVPRPWIFFVSREERFDQIEFHAHLHVGLDTLVCQMPYQQRKLRQSATFDRTTGHSHGGQTPTEPSIPIVEPVPEPLPETVWGLPAEDGAVRAVEATGCEKAEEVRAELTDPEICGIADLPVGAPTGKVAEGSLDDPEQDTGDGEEAMPDYERSEASVLVELSSAAASRVEDASGAWSSDGLPHAAMLPHPSERAPKGKLRNFFSWVFGW